MLVVLGSLKKGGGVNFRCPRHEDILEELGYRAAALILNIGTKYRQEAKFTPRPLYSWEITPVPIKEGDYVRSRAGLDCSREE